ncbi:MAG: lipopolysaccharide heptosyltransferase I [Burkholderiaceae bacterium]|nr:lipopolysaccharide heptosyltransferase I [Burkholderiaceae bacterium]
MKVLIVKLSSLGDVVHAMPAVQDIRACVPGAQIDWVVERGFAPLVRRCDGVNRVIECELRRCRKTFWTAATRAEWKQFKARLQQDAYDAVIDLQGLSKSALVSRLARLTAAGRRHAMANRTEGSSYEVPTRWVADHLVRLAPHVHALDRARRVCAQVFGYTVPQQFHYGLQAQADDTAPQAATVAFVHGSSRPDKCWPQAHWVALGRGLISAGYAIALPHGSDAEQAEAQAIAAQLGTGATVWPRLDLGALTDRLAGCAGVIGVDSGVSHVAVALDLPHVQIYNFDTAWRTGPEPAAAGADVSPARQRSVFAQPTPDVATVQAVWREVAP